MTRKTCKTADYSYDFRQNIIFYDLYYMWFLFRSYKENNWVFCMNWACLWVSARPLVRSLSSREEDFAKERSKIRDKLKSNVRREKRPGIWRQHLSEMLQSVSEKRHGKAAKDIQTLYAFSFLLRYITTIVPNGMQFDRMEFTSDLYAQQWEMPSKFGLFPLNSIIWIDYSTYFHIYVAILYS